MEIRPILSALLRSRTAPLLVAAQVAISLAVLANALYMVDLRLSASMRPSGTTDETTVFTARSRPLAKMSAAEILAKQRREVETLRAIPGVVAVAYTSQMPFSTSGNNSNLMLDPKQTRPAANASVYSSPDSLVTALDLKLVEGRDFNASDVVEVDFETDNNRNAESVIITQALARKLFPESASAIGKTFQQGSGSNPTLRVVGVVERLITPFANTGERGDYSIILPVRFLGAGSLYAVRTAPGQRDSVSKQAEQALRKAAGGPTLTRIRTLDGDRDMRYRDARAMAWMLVAVSALLMLVTASGVVGMTTLRVAQRRKQIGVRRALGGRRIDILRYFMTENAMITGTGVAVGCVLALALNHLLVTRLEMSKLPPAFLLYGAVVFLVLGSASVLGPLLKAARISPSLATRSA